MTGYEQSPDYGSKPPSEWSFVAFLLIIFVVAPLAIWYFTTPPYADCRVVTAADAETYVEDGKRKGLLDLRKLGLKAGECLTIRP